MKELLEQIRTDAEQGINGAAQMQELEALRVKFLGKKGEITQILKQMGKLPAEERPVMGQMANEVRAYISDLLEKRSNEISSRELEKRLLEERIDVTMPGKRHRLGHQHPLSLVLDEIKEIFIGMGFDIAQGT